MLIDYKCGNCKEERCFDADIAGSHLTSCGNCGWFNNVIIGKLPEKSSLLDSTVISTKEFWERAESNSEIPEDQKDLNAELLEEYKDDLNAQFLEELRNM